jgi:hypothetical protein
MIEAATTTASAVTDSRPSGSSQSPTSSDKWGKATSRVAM